MDTVQAIELAWIFRTLHHIATGLNQLHRHDIAHQDLKPSNVLVFREEVGRKLADLGRAWSLGRNPPHNNYDFAGDRTYAPPELLYGFVPSDDRPRRLGCDTYHLGSMVTYFFLGAGATSLLISELHPQFWPGQWTGSYQQVLPYLHEAFARVLLKLSASLNGRFSAELTGIARELCSPDPMLRGHPRNRVNLANQFSLERYVSQFDRLAFQATYHPGQ